MASYLTIHSYILKIKFNIDEDIECRINNYPWKIHEWLNTIKFCIKSDKKGQQRMDTPAIIPILYPHGLCHGLP